MVASVTGKELDEIGLAYDFTLLKKHLGEILVKYDHTNLNEEEPFNRINPSSENIAATIYRKLKKKLAGAPVSLTCIEVWESPQRPGSVPPRLALLYLRQQVGDGVHYQVANVASAAKQVTGHNFLFVFLLDSKRQFSLTYRADQDIH